MSADAISVCPACYAQAMDVPFREVTVQNLNETKLVDRAMREYYDIYIDRGYMVFEFSLSCRDCGYSTPDVEARIPLPLPGGETNKGDSSGKSD